MHVFDDTDVSTSDVLEIEVTAHEPDTTYELVTEEAPDYSYIAYSAHPKDRYTSTSSAHREIFGSSLAFSSPFDYASYITAMQIKLTLVSALIAYMMY